MLSQTKVIRSKDLIAEHDRINKQMIVELQEKNTNYRNIRYYLGVITEKIESYEGRLHEIQTQIEEIEKQYTRTTR